MSLILNGKVGGEDERDVGGEKKGVSTAIVVAVSTTSQAPTVGSEIIEPHVHVPKLPTWRTCPLLSDRHGLISFALRYSGLSFTDHNPVEYECDINPRVWGLDLRRSLLQTRVCARMLLL